ncbi:MAG: glycosyltransferase family 4 protein [Thermaerobacter sp.]|nr:glycosyltransferase family 4 protein [Thermaerobacter sp.]
MRIAMLHWAFPPVVGGVETHLEELGASLVRRGHAVHALVGGESDEDPLQHRGIDVQRSTLFRPVPGVARAELRTVLRRFLDRTRPDVVHVHNMHYFSERHAEVLREVKRERGLPIVLTAHNVWRDQLGYAFLRHADIWDRIIAVSHYLADALVDIGYPRSRVQVMHHGVDPERWSPEPPLPDTPLRIFHPARLSLDKGSLLVVRALHRVRALIPGARLLLAGTGTIVDFESRQAKEVETVREEIARLGLEGAVELRAIPWDEIPEVFARSRVVVYPSRFDEPFGIAALEGMASARPVVVSSVGGMPEFVRDGVDGFVVPPDDDEALAERIALLLGNPVLARRLGAAARQRAVRRFHIRQMVESVLTLYQSVLQRGLVPARV